MTDYHAEGVKLLACVSPPALPRRRHARRRDRARPHVRRANADFDEIPHPPSPAPLGAFPPSLQDQPGPGNYYEDVSPIFKVPGGGTFYIGNIRAAASAATLDAHNITHVVNAQDVDTENFHERDPRFTYLRFPIAHWWSAPEMHTHQGVRDFFAPMFTFVETALHSGHNVMVHCLAGAHRAGTSGVSAVMRFMRLSAPQAVMYVKERRPIVDPIGSFPDLLRKLEKALQDEKR